MVGFDSAIQARFEAIFHRLDCSKDAAEWNWLEVNRLFPKRRMYITTIIRMNSIRMDTPPASDAGRISPLTHDFESFSVKRR